MNGGNGGRARRMRLLAVLTLLVVFAAGALVGAALERGSHHRPPRGALPRGGGPPPMFAEGSPIAQRLKLTGAQRDSIERITTRERMRGDSVFHHTRRQMRAHFDSTLSAVDAVLTPQQRQEWRRIREQWHEADMPGDAHPRHGPAGGPHGAGPHGPPAGPAH